MPSDLQRLNRTFPESILGFLEDNPTKEPSIGSDGVYVQGYPSWPNESKEVDVEVEELLPVPRFQDLRVIGQLNTTYILCEGAGEMVVIDQHAAHERITLYAIMKKNAGQGIAWGQRLLTPIFGELNPARFHALQDSLPLLERFGFELEPFGGSTMAIRQVPQFLMVSIVQAY